MPVVRTSDAVVHEIHGTRFLSYATPARGSRELCAWRGEIPAGTSSPVHTVTREEIFYLLSGAVEVTLDGRTEPLAPGDAAVINAGVPVQIHNRGTETAIAWVTTSVGMEVDLEDGTHLAPPWAN
ncbi:cupin domain-containing protein [Streptomyces sp. A3M-1-3]|uniref:cupin domain-containing protein n=1 Tax=Streptomyces sp. A3M-1-3 TaxID=2962044 RepID=UPI0020B8BA12|nr:cupin domain-containing protein [Streptomyces sp. A3M-1-3]MCP3822545.1 cupin domain-containing protein [Streptomyces sp. A3M-1-3]